MKTILGIVSCWAALLLQCPCFAQTLSLTQAWPSKPIRFLVPYAPGGPTDLVARLIGQKLTETIGQQVIIDNRSGAGGNIGTVAVAKSLPDGYTVLVTVSAIVINVSLYPHAGYDVERDFVPVVLVARQPELIVVNGNSSAKNLSDLLGSGKASKLVFATPGSGTPGHLTGENLFNLLAKLTMTPVHFRGAGPAVAAVLAGEPPTGVMGVTAPLPHIKAGRLRALAVSSAERIDVLPEVPTLTELGFPGVQDYLWIGIFLPAGAPAVIVHKLNELVNHAIQSADVRKRLEAQAFEVVGGSPQQAAEYVRTELIKWSKVVRETGAKPD